MSVSKAPRIRPSSFSMVELAKIQLVAQRAQALLLGGVEQALPGDAGLPATSASQLERSATTGAASSAARVRFAEIT